MDQSAENRAAAIRASLRMVLVKLTGERQAARNTALLPLLNRAEKLVQQYRYKEVRSGPVDEPATGETALHLAVTFDEETLNKSLRELGVAIWPKERSSVLVWLVVEKDRQRTFASPDETPDLLDALYKRARQRGVPILFPLLDLEDHGRIKPHDVWGDFKETIMAASARYRADIILTASMSSPTAGIWEGRWTAYRNNAAYREWVTETDLLAFAMDEGIDNMADILAAEYAQASIDTELREVEITVTDIHSVEQYARVMGYLHSLSSISEIQVREVETGEVTLALMAHGGEVAVMQALSLGRVLEPLQGGGDHDYRLLP